jgi:hypothetical protein
LPTNAATEQRDAPAGLQAWQQVAIFLLACAVLISRRPEYIFHAQFYAEDGHVWFADAYNLGWWHALFRAQDGYFQVFPRLGAALALLAPMERAPLLTNLVALAVQALPVSLLLSSRSSGWGGLKFRALLAAVYLALPNCSEVGCGITESQWLLALTSFLLLVACTAHSWTGRIFHFGILLLSGLTGPFCVFLLPIAVFLARKRRDRWQWASAGLLAACALVQAYALLVIDRVGRPVDALGATPALFIRILSGNVILGAVLGRTGLAVMPGRGIFLLLVFAAIVGVTITIACFLKSSLEMKLFFIWTGVLFVISLLIPNAHPAPGSPDHVWTLLAKGTGARYWFFPSLVFAWSLLWAVESKQKAMKALSLIMLVPMCFTIVLSWEQPLLRNYCFAEYVRSFEAAPKGTVAVIPENPDGWNIRLVKRASN